MDRVTKAVEKKKPDILGIMAAKYNLDPGKFKETVKATVMKTGKDGRQVSDEEFMAFLMVAHKYDLDPFTNEIYAYPSKKGGIIPVVGIDGYVRKICNHPDFDGMEIEFSEKMTTPDGGKECPEWCAVRLYRKGIQRPIVAIEYLDEVYRKTEYESPWKTHTKRMLRHKAIIQAGRIAGFLVGIYDEDEAQRIIEVEASTEPIKLPQPKTVENKNETNGPYKQMLERFAKAKELLDDKYYEILSAHGYEHANQVKSVEEGNNILQEMREILTDAK